MIHLNMIHNQMVSTLHPIFEASLSDIMLSQYDHPNKCGSQDDRAWEIDLEVVKCVEIR